MFIDIGIFIVRAVIVVIGTWLVTSFIGKKSVAQLTPYEVAILFIVSNVAAQPLVSMDSFKTAFSMVLLGVSIVLLSYLSTKKPFYRLNATPSIVINKGQINMKELKRNRMSIYALLSMLRSQGFFRIADVEYAILELGGDLSVLSKEAARPVTPEDLKLNPEQQELSYAVVVDGVIVEEALRALHQSKEALVMSIERQYHVGIGKVLYAEMDSQGTLYANLRPIYNEGNISS
ncbi:DUF421 domain-containing protein [Priestia koreensis]|uniref:DUF421 domain-containing protein n=1 Tax=Priestia koreensis TaxID=284581 RepID=UPI001F55EB5F|nr:YetF domain-containing protein [Priestia koreensis]UNL84080.1 DUF421 domain-containing protein [Priestia koreensis]